MNLESEKVRNVALVAHGGAGKTSLAEAMIFNSGETSRMGRVEDGNTIMDYDEEERKRTASINSSFYQFKWKKNIISLIDTPGDQNFFSDAKTSLPAADGAVVVIESASGVEVRTEQAVQFASDNHLPCVAFINKLDQERSDYRKALQSAVDHLEPKPILLQLPIGEKGDFKGVVDLIANKAFIYKDGKATSSDIPADMADDVEAERAELIENIAEADDELLERYLEGGEITDSELIKALQAGTKNRLFMPVLIGSATQNIGVDLLCDFIANCMPTPLERKPFFAKDASGNMVEVKVDANGPLAGFVFKTIVDPYAGRLSVFKIVSGTLGKDGSLYNVNKGAKERYTQLLILQGKEQKTIDSAGPGTIVAFAKLKETFTGDSLCADNNKLEFEKTKPISPVISFAVEATKQGDEDKIYSSLTRLQEEDSALYLSRNAETKEILVSGVGMIHIEATIEKVKRKFNVEMALKSPKVPYRETIKKKVRVQGRHKKQSGGHGQFGDCWIQMEPLPRGGGFEFVDAVVGGSVPRNYIPAIEKGIVETAVRGCLAGFPCVDFKVTLDDGSYHAVDSSEMAFKIAGALAFKKASETASPVLLEPVMKVSVIAPDDFTGDIMGDLNSRRGRVLGMDSEGKYQIINANVPMSEILMYASDLNSMTGARGTFTMELSHYDEVPAEIAVKIVEKVKAEQESK